jgi:hypothetical protein
MVVNNPAALDKFCEYALSLLELIKEQQSLTSSTKITCVYSVLIACYWIPGVGVITKEFALDWLGCADGAMTFITHPEKMSACQRNSLAKTTVPG